MQLFVLIMALLPVLLTDISLANQKSAQLVLQKFEKLVVRSSSRTVDSVLDALVSENAPETAEVLAKWEAKELYFLQTDKRFYFIDNRTTTNNDKIQLVLFDGSYGPLLTTDKALKQLKPNSGVRKKIRQRLVRFQLQDTTPSVRALALTQLERNATQEHLEPLQEALASETEPNLRARMERLQRRLLISFGQDSSTRVTNIEFLSSDISVDVRQTLNPLIETELFILHASESLEGKNIKKQLIVGQDISVEDAYAILVDKGLEPRLMGKEERNKILIDNIKDGKVADIPVSLLNQQNMRDRAYTNLVAAGLAPNEFTTQQLRQKLTAYKFFHIYIEKDSAVTAAAEAALKDINQKVGFYKAFDLLLDSLSLASIYFLAAIGLAITFGVMGIINMAHGEFIMIGAYTGYVVQQIIPDYTIALLVAIPLAFCITFCAGVLLERSVIRHLRQRPLETLLATFGISIALQQLAKNIFGTQARPLTAPDWLDGALIVNDVVSISLIRIAIFFLALLFLAILIYVLKRTRFGLEVRAVTQNARMASSVGINPEKVNMLTFGLGSGIAGIAGIAIGLFAQVTSEIGSAYIVQSFMTVVVGGVGNIWGTMAGAGMIGGVQKAIEWLYPSNTLAAQTYMIIFIIIFIQFRPKGIIALKGRAAED